MGKMTALEEHLNKQLFDFRFGFGRFAFASCKSRSPALDHLPLRAQVYSVTQVTQPVRPGQTPGLFTPLPWPEPVQGEYVDL